MPDLTPQLTPTDLNQLRINQVGFRQSHAIIIGVNQYPLVKKDLLSAVPDAWQLAKLLWEKQGFDHVWLYVNPFAEDLHELFAGLKRETGAKFPPKAKLEIQTTADATKAWKDLFTTRNQPKKNKLQRIYHFHQGKPFDHLQAGEVDGEGDSLVFYYAGHGQAGTFGDGPTGYLIPSDVSDSADMDNRIAMEHLQEALNTAGCKHTLLVLDCCFAGKFRHVNSGQRPGARSERRPITNEAFDRFRWKQARQVLISAGADQTAADWIKDRGEDIELEEETDEFKLPHSPFAKALFQALMGMADFAHKGKDSGDGVLTATELKLYIFDQVEKVSRDAPDFPIQNPDLFPMKDHDGGEFIFLNPKNPAFEFAQWQHLNPYKGLMAYEGGDWPFFFGREIPIRDVEQKLQHSPVLLISASSGLGKSSLVKAGIFPRLAKAGYQTHVFRPGAQPWSGKKVEVRPLGTEPETADPIYYWTGLKELKDIIDAAVDQPKHAILLDQFEELFLEDRNAVSVDMGPESTGPFSSIHSGPASPESEQSERAKFEEELVQLMGQSVKHQIDRQEWSTQVEAAFKATQGWDVIKSTIKDWPDRIATATKSKLLKTIAQAEEQELAGFELTDLQEDLLQTWEAAHPEERVLIFSLRSDFEWQFDNSRTGKEIALYAKALSKHSPYPHRYRLGPMGLDELRDALIGPALIRGFEFESEELIGEILEEIGYAPAALPLLSLSMNHLFALTEKEIQTSGRDKRVFTRGMYQQSGGVTGALTSIADGFYKNLAETNVALQSEMRNLFLRMLRLNNGEFTRRRIYYHKNQPGHELDFPNRPFALLEKELLNPLIQAQLLVGGEDETGQAYIEPAHDALLNHWPVCLQWIEKYGKENLVLQQQLWQAVGEYDLYLEEKQNEHNLDQMRQVTAAELMPPEDLVTRVSPLWDTSPKLLQLLEYLLDPGRGWVSVTPDTPFRKKLDTWAKTLPENDARAIQDLCNNWDLVLGRKSNFDRIQSLSDGNTSGLSNQLITFILDHADHWMNQKEVAFIQLSWEDREIRLITLVKERDDAIKAKKAAERNELTANYHLAKLYEEKAALALDKQEYAQAWLYNLEALQQKIDQKKALPSAVGFLLYQEYCPRPPDLPRNPTWQASGKIQQIIFSGEQEVEVIGVEEKLIGTVGELHFIHHLRNSGQSSASKPMHHWRGASISGDGAFAAITNLNRVNLYQKNNLGTFELTVSHPCIEQVITMAFSPDNKRLACGSLSGELEFFELSSPATLTSKDRLVGEDGVSIFSLAFVPQGNYLAVGFENGTIKTYEDYHLHRTYRKNGSTVNALCFSPDKSLLASAHDNGGLQVINLQAGYFDTWQPEDKQPASVSQLLFLDNERLVLGDEKGVLSFFHLLFPKNPLRLLALFRAHEAGVTALAYDPVRKILYSGSQAGLVRQTDLRITPFMNRISLDLLNFMTNSSSEYRKTLLSHLYDYAYKVLPFSWRQSDLQVDDELNLKEANAEFFGGPQPFQYFSGGGYLLLNVRNGKRFWEMYSHKTQEDLISNPQIVWREVKRDEAWIYLDDEKTDVFLRLPLKNHWLQVSPREDWRNLLKVTEMFQYRHPNGHFITYTERQDLEGVPEWVRSQDGAKDIPISCEKRDSEWSYFIDGGVQIRFPNNGGFHQRNEEGVWKTIEDNRPYRHRFNINPNHLEISDHRRPNTWTHTFSDKEKIHYQEHQRDLSWIYLNNLDPIGPESLRIPKRAGNAQVGMVGVNKWINADFQRMPAWHQIPDQAVYKTNGRIATYSQVQLNAAGNYLEVDPGQDVTIRLNWRITVDKAAISKESEFWIFQFYHGIHGVYSKGIISSTFSSFCKGNFGKSEVTFQAPSTPGIYYITYRMTLERQFMEDPNSHSKSQTDAMGVIIVRESGPPKIS